MNTDIHRLLDEAFAGVEMTAENQDLKEEIRANLMARVAELETSGASPADAAARAIAELGDVHELVDTEQASEPGDPARSAPARTAAAAHGDAHGFAFVAGRRVRPRPGFVVRTVVLSLVAAAALVLFVLGATSVLPTGLGVLIGLGALVAVPLGVVTADALAQETTTNHPLPRRRAAGFGLATFGTLAALALGAAFAAHLAASWLVVLAALVLVASIAGFAWLGATQTNRHKAWTRQAHAQLPLNRFEQEPETAARFGIYVAAIWLLTFAVIAVLVFTVGWWWAPVAFLGGLVAMMTVLARMMFGPRKSPN